MIATYFDGIDLSSDTATKPCAKMRQAMANAQVGDDQRGEDPTTNELQAYAAELLNKPAALFLPCATQANQIALMLHCHSGDQVIAAQNSHIASFEAGGPAVLARVMLRTINTPSNIFTPEQVAQLSLFPMPHCAQSKLIAIENTTNMSGGIPWSLAQLAAIQEYAYQEKLLLHMDGARLFNAAVALGVTSAEIVAGFDSVTVCLSKGLGAPMGALLLGSQEFIQRAVRYKHLLGGALRQSGIVAAAGLYALKNNRQNLARDHQLARLFAEKLATLSGVALCNQTVMSNIILFKVSHPKLTTEQFLQACLAKNVRFSTGLNQTVRAVTHLDIQAQQIDHAIQVIKDVLKTAS